MLRWQQVERRREDEAVVRAIFRPDIYDAALARAPWSLQIPKPGVDRLEAGDETFFDRRPFDPTDIDAYLAHIRRS
jgi:hypothetical protein